MFHHLKLSGRQGTIFFNGLNVGSVFGWSFNLDKPEPEIAVEGYNFNRIWYRFQRWYDLRLYMGDGVYCCIKARPIGHPQVGRIMASRLIFEGREPLNFIRRK